jgi:hypothetical protein
LTFLFKQIRKPDKKEHFRYKHNENCGVKDVPFKFGIVHNNLFGFKRLYIDTCFIAKIGLTPFPSPCGEG